MRITVETHTEKYAWFTTQNIITLEVMYENNKFRVQLMTLTFLQMLKCIR